MCSTSYSASIGFWSSRDCSSPPFRALRARDPNRYFEGSKRLFGLENSSKRFVCGSLSPPILQHQYGLPEGNHTSCYYDRKGTEICSSCFLCNLPGSILFIVFRTAAHLSCLRRGTPKTCLYMYFFGCTRGSCSCIVFCCVTMHEGVSFSYQRFRNMWCATGDLKEKESFL